MDLYEQLLRTTYLDELTGDHQAYSATTNTVQFNGVSTAYDTISVDYAPRTDWRSEYFYYQTFVPEYDYAEIEARRKREVPEDDESLEVSEEMHRFIEELEETKKTERGV